MIILKQDSVRSNAKDNFLSLFPNKHKSHISNIFFEVIRNGAKTVDEVLFHVITKAVIKLQAARQYNDPYNEVKFGLILRNLNNNQKQAQAFALYCLTWESLPKEIKEADKNKRAGYYRAKYLDAQPATDKQRLYLKKLGWTGAVISKQHASRLIDRLTGGGNK
ncbi:MAG: hypothetical protein A4E56_01885 [Pelotomaculum sp. PtaU1.Bin065]|nr:MAG: hypothetical protein A4E56_01885 [Pelotomaculum sp. PtaU1.Bin065]